MMRNGLCHYADRLHECFETAARKMDAVSPAVFVGYAIDHWSAAVADVPSLCRTLAALYFDVCDAESRSRVRGRLVGHMAARLQRSSFEAVAVGGGASSVSCRAYVDFCGWLIDDVSAAEAVRDNGGADSLDRVAEALVAVYRTHPVYDCVDSAGRLLRRLIGGRRLVGDAIRIAAMEVLVEDRLRAMNENLVDTAF